METSSTSPVYSSRNRHYICHSCPFTRGHVTVTHDTLDLTVQGHLPPSFPPSRTWDPTLQALPPGDDTWRLRSKAGSMYPTRMLSHVWSYNFDGEPYRSIIKLSFLLFVSVTKLSALESWQKGQIFRHWQLLSLKPKNELLVQWRNHRWDMN